MMNRTSPESSLKWENCFAMTATSLAALSLAPSEASAAVVKVLDRPVAMPFNYGVADWDVDGNGAVDFSLFNYFSESGVFLSNNSLGQQPRGRGLVGPNASDRKVREALKNLHQHPEHPGCRKGS